MAAPTKYKKEFLTILATYEDNPLALTDNGKISNTKLAKIFKVDKSTIGNWLTPGSGYYEPAFAKMIRRLQNVIYCGEIKESAIERAKKHKQHKFTYEPKEVRVMLPPLSKMGKKALLEYARYALKIKVDSKLTKPIIEHEIRTAAQGMIKTEMVVTKHEITDVPADPAAIKMVVPNIQPKDDLEPWKFEETVTVDASPTLANLLKKL
ncbi:MAG: hypothetical protein PHY02_09720 [Phycisphaerae bacterium]|nr:hypothetical protein [Phycisphaerae bacterium]